MIKMYTGNNGMGITDGFSKSRLVGKEVTEE